MLCLLPKTVFWTAIVTQCSLTPSQGELNAIWISQQKLLSREHIILNLGPVQEITLYKDNHGLRELLAFTQQSLRYSPSLWAQLQANITSGTPEQHSQTLTQRQHPNPRLVNIIVALISLATDQLIIHGSIKMQRLKGVSLLAPAKTKKNH